VDKSDFPLCEFNGWLKQVNLDGLSEFARHALELVFPHLTPPSRQDVDRSAQRLREEGEFDHVIPVYVNKRRFAGDWTLGPRRYYTLAQGRSGNDYGTMLAELVAYYDISVGLCVVHENPKEELTARLGIPHKDQSLLIEIPGTPGSNALLARIGINTVWIPIRVEKIQIPDVLDLRYFDVQEWFCREFGDVHKHAAAELSKHTKPGADLSDKFPKYNAPASFLDMLPVLMDPNRGGNAVTDMIGQILRFHNVSGLVYPSARTPSGVDWVEGKMDRFPGWNLVDYRGSGSQFLEGITLFLGKDPWESEHADLFDLEKIDNQGSWTMFPPKRKQRRDPTVLTSDDDLRVRYRAGMEIFTGLIYLALQAQQDEELAWLDAISNACSTQNGYAILQWMGIKAARHFASEAAPGEEAVLFECATAETARGRVSKGYGCLQAPPVKVYDSLDEEPEGYSPGTPAFAELDKGLYLFYLRETA